MQRKQEERRKEFKKTIDQEGTDSTLLLFLCHFSTSCDGDDSLND
jgi:hypothetical protein